ncbi:alpha/beta fold hydrolase [Zobellia galactanivorans]|uniref:Serine peptidase, family S9 n=1 Tax=Zobellia galactanivorans (strain DSM 12802 / CCUG 47099 / CIP 106680 / NCIMB 13871 / Dsij) TaxID=63186 RepID=G0L2Y6_ZOBGA|nr:MULTISPECIES: alpha/beta fold hydrolase [Zobellia]MBU3025031.1 lysophospholipase [Zobellia galactanivorans]MDO6808669.1 alpha/beta fold hydrolase [Zobellia galactanivorans]OWW25649.1 alpha/beta hydrolase [Zobellia sp. OII3]CAZ98275.1 Serine peptidase, family S9 [Zobellia galactanivorans]
MRRLKKWGLILVILYVLIAVLAYTYQERLVFFPSKMPLSHTYDFCQDFEEFYLTANDGAKLNAVHIKQPEAKGIVLYFHGNSGNISHLTHVANLFSRKGYESVLVDYRTYGKSTGEVSEQALYDDAQMFYDYIREKYDEEDILVYGRSFGTGIATWLASKNEPKKLILESPFYSAVALGKYRFPFLPIDWLSNFRFPSNEYVKKIDCPIYIFHGKEDSVIPYESAQKLYEAIPGKNKELLTIAEGGHNYLQDFKTFKEGMDKILN